MPDTEPLPSPQQAAGSTRPLGVPIPDSPHAVSVSMPTWADVIGYEEGDPRVLNALACGYPRFVFHPQVRALMETVTAHFAKPDEHALILPSEAAARRCLAYVQREGHSGRLETHAGVAVVLVPVAAQAIAKRYWQHTGEIVSSRRAAAVLAGKSDTTDTSVKQALRSRLAALVGVSPEQVWLFPSGMAAIYQALRLMQAVHPDRRTAQFCFPYVDTLKLQERLGNGVHFYPIADGRELDALTARLKADEVGGIFCELPSNPLMRSVDLARLSQEAKAAGVPLAVDDSAASFYNHDFLPYADLLVGSLTKYFSGSGEAMGGVLIVNPASPFAAAFADHLDRDYEDLLFGKDAAVLLQGSQDFSDRMAIVNRNALALTELLASHPAVERIYYPTYETTDCYRQALRPGGSYGGMFSLTLRQPERSAAFYDALAVDKGPSFGLRTTLACPYTLLAHYTELEWAETCEVPRHLIRVSVGTEPIEVLTERMLAALSSIS